MKDAEPEKENAYRLSISYSSAASRIFQRKRENGFEQWYRSDMRQTLHGK